MTETVISMLTYNKLSITKKCLETIFANTTVPFILVVSDNGSTDGTVEYLKDLPQVHFINNKRNIGFSKANNHVLKIYDGYDVVLMNNDIEVPKRWLERLMMYREKNGLGAVTPAIKVSTGLDVGATLNANARGRSVIEQPGKPTETEFDWITGSCLYLKTETIQTVGYLDEDFMFYYEDVDYCRRMKEKGIKFDCNRDVHIIHHDSSSSTPGQKKAMLEKSRQYFCNKWGYSV